MNTTSIYISRVNYTHTEETIRTLFHTINIGLVDSVDFIVPGQKPGFIEPEPVSRVKSAFIHFYHHHCNHQHPFWTRILFGNKFRIDVSYSEYWICSKTHNPIQSTIMNVHQLVDNCRNLEMLVAQQATSISKLEDDISTLYATIHTNSQLQQHRIDRLEASLLKMAECGSLSVSNSTRDSVSNQDHDNDNKLSSMSDEDHDNDDKLSSMPDKDHDGDDDFPTTHEIITIAEPFRLQCISINPDAPFNPIQTTLFNYTDTTTTSICDRDLIDWESTTPLLHIPLPPNVVPDNTFICSLPDSDIVSIINNTLKKHHVLCKFYPQNAQWDVVYESVNFTISLYKAVNHVIVHIYRLHISHDDDINNVDGLYLAQAFNLIKDDIELDLTITV